MARIPPSAGRWVVLKMEIGNWKLETANQKLEIGKWELGQPVSSFCFMALIRKRGTGNQKADIRNQKTRLPVSNFQFPVSIFQFLVSPCRPHRPGLTLLRARQILSLVGLRNTGRK
jgi:hypothetical protein